MASPSSEPLAPRSPLLVLPVALLGLLLLFATTQQGAFALQYWAPPAIFTVVVLATVQASGGGIPLRSRWTGLALIGLWGLAAWALVSLAWTDGASTGAGAAGRLLLYVALFTLPIVVRPWLRGLQLVGWALVAGVVVIGVITLIRLFVDGLDVMLAGRLDAPVGYRNATACLFVLAFWPLVCAAATRDYGRVVRGMALGGAVLMLGLAFLTQSRGMVLGLAVGGVVLLLIVPNRVRVAWTTVLAVGITAAGAPILLKPYNAFIDHNGVVTSGDVHQAAVALTIITVVGFAVGLLVAVFDAGLRNAGEPGPGAQVRRQMARVGLALLVLLAVVAVIAKVGDPVSYANQKWDEFRDVNGTATAGATRLTSTGGQRYDLWRVAVRQFEADPVQGGGLGSYGSAYYKNRATDRNLDNPHGLAFEVLGELGLVGTVLALLFLAGLAGAIFTGARRAPPNVRRSAGALAAAGMVVLGQSLVDWMDLIPGVFGLGLLMLGLAVAQLLAAREPAGPVRRLPVWWRVVSTAGLAVCALFLSAMLLSTAYTNKARALAGGAVSTGKVTQAQPQRELDAARTAADLDPLAVNPLFLQASALESLGRVGEARAALQEAQDIEPKSFVVLGLIGDLEVRAGRPAQALAAYRQALALNPGDVGLRKLVRASVRAERRQSG